MLVLQENQQCPHSMKCQYNQFESCMGAHPNRSTVFECSYVNDNGNISENGQIRNSLDQTGQMKIIME